MGLFKGMSRDEEPNLTPEERAQVIEVLHGVERMKTAERQEAEAAEKEED